MNAKPASPPEASVTPAASAVEVVVDGIACQIEITSDGCLRVTHESRQLTPMNGPGTAGQVMYVVHPAQRQHYEFLVGLLPRDRRPESRPDAPRPWWSFVPGAKEQRGHGKDDAAE